MRSTGEKRGSTLKSLCALLLLAVGTLSAQQRTTTLQELFVSANEHYGRGEYRAAFEAYDELLRIQGPGAGLYYNRGCAGLKDGRLGSAVADFHRAARLAPRDPDIQANLRFVLALVRPENEEDAREGFVNGTLLRWVFLLSGREVGLIQFGLLLFVTIGATALAAGYRGGLRRMMISATVAGTLLLALNSFLLAAHHYRDHRLHQAVVIEPNAEARSGPGEDNTRVLVLPEGTVVRKREERGGWVLISLPSGRSGWVQAGKIELI